MTGQYNCETAPLWGGGTGPLGGGSHIVAGSRRGSIASSDFSQKFKIGGYHFWYLCGIIKIGGDNMLEEWREIKGFEGKYWVSNMGRIRNKTKVLKVYTDKQEYVKINLGNKNNAKRVHRLVAETFIPNPDNLPFVNHRNEIRNDNRVVNLEWCTHEYNVNYGTAQERKAKALRGEVKGGYVFKGTSAKKLWQINPITNEIINTWNSFHEAEREGFIRASIRRCLRGDRVTHGGFRWEYAEEH
jgi:hypothetical protein